MISLSWCKDCTFGPTDTVFVDGKSFDKCIFDRCTMVYSGNDFSLCNSTLNNVQWVFEGPAAGAVQLLSLLYANGAVVTVETTFDKIKKGCFLPNKIPA